MEPPRPFRWDLAGRHRLGALLEGAIAPSYDGFFEDLLCAGARVIALSDDSDLFFVGRSLESMFDLFSGLLLDTSWAGRLQLLPFSSRFQDLTRIQYQYPDAILALRAYLSSLSLSPAMIARRSCRVAFVDVVSSGSTLGNLIQQLMLWSQDDDVTWSAVAPQLRIVGITKQQKSSPKTWRWQQHSTWPSVLPSGSIKNVSVPVRMYQFVPEEQLKVSISFPPWRWGREDVELPNRDARTLEALRLAVRLFDYGIQKRTGTEFATLLAEQPSMKHRWFRSLVMDLKR